jgi:hypothetical protein
VILSKGFRGMAGGVERKRGTTTGSGGAVRC